MQPVAALFVYDITRAQQVGPESNDKTCCPTWLGFYTNDRESPVDSALYARREIDRFLINSVRLKTVEVFILALSLRDSVSIRTEYVVRVIYEILK